MGDMTPTEAAEDLANAPGNHFISDHVEAIRILDAHHARATAAPGDLAALAEEIAALVDAPLFEMRERARSLAASVRARALDAHTAHRCAPAVEVARPRVSVEDVEQTIRATVHVNGTLKDFLGGDTTTAVAEKLVELFAAPPAEGEAASGGGWTLSGDALYGAAAERARQTWPEALATPLADLFANLAYYREEIAGSWHEAGEGLARGVLHNDAPAAPPADSTPQDGDCTDALARAYDHGRRDATSPSPEVVSEAQAAQLPERSKFVACDEYGMPYGGSSVNVIGGYRSPRTVDGHMLVLYRAPVPPAPLAFGDPVETAEQLDALPVGAVVRDDLGGIAARHRRGWGYTDGVGFSTFVPLPARVLDLPEASS